MRAFLVCDPDLGCVVRLADTASKARWAGCLEIGGSPHYDFEDLTRLTVCRIPGYDGDDPDEAYRTYWRDHDGDTGEPITAAPGAPEGGQP